MSEKSAQRLINLLTNDEDLRQDLWICHLSGTPMASLKKQSEQLKFEQKVEEDFNHAIFDFIKSPLSESLVNNFTDLELSIIFHLAVGHDIITISRYKGITEVRVRQMIASIKSSNAWDDIWRSREILQTKRNSV